MMLFLDTDGRVYHAFFIGEPRRVSLFPVSPPAFCRDGTGVLPESAGACDVPQTGSPLAHDQTHAPNNDLHTPGQEALSLP